MGLESILPFQVGFSFEVVARDGRARWAACSRRTAWSRRRSSCRSARGRGQGRAAPRAARDAGRAIMLANTYHLLLRPGDELVPSSAGCTASGLAGADPHRQRRLPGVQPGGTAQDRRRGRALPSHIDGSAHLLTPERSMEIQQNLGADIMMAFDECPPWRRRRASSWPRRSRAPRAGRGAAAPPTRAPISRCSASSRAASISTCARRAPATDRARLPGLRRRRALGRRAQARRATACSSPRPVLPAGQAALPDGRRHPGGHPRGRGPRHRHVRLRAAHPQRPQRPALHPRGRLSIRNARYRDDPRPPDPECSCSTCRSTSGPTCATCTWRARCRRRSSPAPQLLLLP